MRREIFIFPKVQLLLEILEKSSVYILPTATEGVYVGD